MESSPDDCTDELLVFVKDMADFERNRGTKVEQEQLIRERLGSDHTFFGAFDDSGNYAFAAAHGPDRLGHDVLAALGTRYHVREAVVVRRAEAAGALDGLERAAHECYGKAFSSKDYGVQRPTGRWRVGVVFVGPEIPLAQVEGLRVLDTLTLTTLTVTPRVVGIAKLDSGRRIPWGHPAGEVAKRLKAAVPGVVATGRSGRTVRGVLRLFPRDPPSPAHDGGRRPTAPREPEPEVTAPHTMTARPAQEVEEPGGVMSDEARADDFAPIEAMLRGHSGLKRAGPAMVNAFVQVARAVWGDSSGTIEPRRAGDSETFIPFSPVGTNRNLADTAFGPRGIRIDFKIPKDVLVTIDPSGRTDVLAATQGRRRPFNRTLTFKNPQDAPFVAELILACVLDRSQVSEPAPQIQPQPAGAPDLDIQGSLRVWWDESERAFRADFWRLCVILCAGILEGRLREVLESPGSAARQGPPVDLVDLLRHAKEDGVLGSETVSECHAVRQMRNRAVHPPRPGERSAAFTREVAQIARQVVQRCCQELRPDDHTRR